MGSSNRLFLSNKAIETTEPWFQEISNMGAVAFIHKEVATVDWALLPLSTRS